MISPHDDLVERLPTLPDDDSDFTPELGRKIIAGYHRIIEQQAAEIERLREALEITLAFSVSDSLAKSNGQRLADVCQDWIAIKRRARSALTSDIPA